MCYFYFVKILTMIRFVNLNLLPALIAKPFNSGYWIHRKQRMKREIEKQNDFSI